MPVTQEEIREWSRQFYKALKTGDSLLECLNITMQQQHNQDFTGVLIEVRDLVARGYPLSKIMALHPHVFDADYITIIRYGEIFGEVDCVLERYVERPEEMYKPCRPETV